MRKFLKKKVWVDAIDFVNKIVEIGIIFAIFEPFEVLLLSKYLDQVEGRKKHATCWRIQPIVPRFISKAFTKRTFHGNFA